jgi:hypothetical protein
MIDPNKKLEQISDIGDKVGGVIGTIIRFIVKNGLYLIIVATIGVFIFLSSVIYSAWNKKRAKIL